MKRISIILPRIVVLAALASAGAFSFGLFPDASSSSDNETLGDAKPASVTVEAETGLGRVVLTDRARERLGVATAPVEREPLSLPYAAVLYDATGGTWVYANPEALVYVRHHIVVERINGDRAVLSSGPPVGTAVVTTGAAELFGIEFGVGK